MSCRTETTVEIGGELLTRAREVAARDGAPARQGARRC
jgi:hypothetical protein